MRKRLLTIFFALPVAFAAAQALQLQPAPQQPETFPLLEQLNRETQSLFNEVNAGIVRVQLPTPKWIREAAAKDDPLKKWEPVVDAKVKECIDQARTQNAQTGQVQKIQANVVSPPSTRPAPAGEPATRPGWTVQRSGKEIIIQPGESGAALILHAGKENGPDTTPPPVAPVRARDAAAGGFAPNNVGLVLDEQGHVLIPLFIEKETFGDAPVRMMIGDRETAAKFVGSDSKTNLTVLKMTEVIGKPVHFSAARPGQGALVMLLNPSAAAGKLMLWTGGQRDYGVVVLMDGSVAGFVRFGQFLSGVASQNVIAQLINKGKVERAILGVRLTEVRADSPIRQVQSALADRPALTIEEVSAGSLAEQAGLKKGDLLLQLDDQPVGDLATWSALSARGGKAQVRVLREGMELNLEVNLQVAE